MIVMGLVLALWRLGFMRLIMQAGVRARVLVIGTRTIGKMVAEELYLKKSLGMQVVGFVSEKAGQITLTYGNPRKVEIPVFAPPSLSGLVASIGADRILLASADHCSPSYFYQLVTVRAMGGALLGCPSFFYRLA